MKYPIFQNEKTIIEDVSNQFSILQDKYNNSGDYDYAEVGFYVIGDDLFKMVEDNFPMLKGVVRECTWSGEKKKIASLKEKSKLTIGEFVNSYRFQLYNSNGTVGVSHDCYVQTVLRLNYEFFLRPYFASAPSNMRAEFFIFNDDRDYSSYLPYNFDKENPHPNAMGSLTDKKLKEWAIYLAEKAKLHDTEKMRRENSVEALINMLHNTIDEEKCDRFEISDIGYNGAREIVIVANNLKLTYKVHSNNTYWADIDFDKKYPYSPLEMFLNMTGTKKEKNADPA